jgi:hypothetical protein
MALCRMSTIKVKNHLKVKNGGRLSIDDLNDQLREIQVKMEGVRPSTLRYDNLHVEMIYLRASIELKVQRLLRHDSITN